MFSQNMQEKCVYRNEKIKTIINTIYYIKNRKLIKIRAEKCYSLKFRMLDSEKDTNLLFKSFELMF